MNLSMTTGGKVQVVVQQEYDRANDTRMAQALLPG
jgi:hypothetical protein